HRGIEMGTDQALRRARLLDLGDEREGAMRVLGLQCLTKAAGSGDVGSTSLDLSERKGCLRGSDFLALVGFDLAQDVGHALPPRFDTSISFSSFACAAPLSMASVASLMPSFRSAAFAATTSAAAAFSTAISRYGHVSPARTPRNALALCSASAPLRSACVTRARPTCSGVTSKVRIWPLRTSATC